MPWYYYYYYPRFCIPLLSMIFSFLIHILAFNCQISVLLGFFFVCLFVFYLRICQLQIGTFPSTTNGHLPIASASNWTTRAFAIYLCCCSCWPLTLPEGNSGWRERHSAPGKLSDVFRNWFHDPNPCISSYLEKH